MSRVCVQPTDSLQLAEVWTSHAALVARGWGKCCIVGCDALHINMNTRTITIGDKLYKEGDVFSLNGSKGLVYGGGHRDRECFRESSFYRIP